MNYSKPGRMYVLNCFMRAHTYTYSHHSRRQHIQVQLSLTLSVYCYPAVNQTPALIVLDGFEPPALIQTRPLFKLRPLFGQIRYVHYMSKLYNTRGI